MILEHTNYRNFLRANLASRINKNPSYSLRAFAGFLKVSPSMLSDVLKGKKSLSSDLALRISQALELSEREAEYFQALVQFESAKTPELKNRLQEKINKLNSRRKFFDLNLEAFKAISDPVHVSILEMATIDQIRLTAALAAKALEISEIEAQVVFDRLLQLELIEERKGGGYRKVENHLLTKSIHPNAALRRFHKASLERAIEAIESQPNTKKFIGSETFAFDSSALKQAEEILEECFSKIVNLSQRSKKPDAVYHLGIQMFRFTKKEFEK